MEKESFEDEEVARYLNDTFVCIKVDREERPDIDAVYMAACQMITGSGGWPLSIFMTPDQKPFFAATYLPKTTRFGRIGLIELCQRVQQLWQQDQSQVTKSARQLNQALGRVFDYQPGEPLTAAVLDQAYRTIAPSFDPVYGGFESAPKFPMPHRLQFLLRYHHRTGEAQALQMVEKTLRSMRLSGLWDHVGFGFHRYSTDKKWLVPHFEKMLYDQALLAMAYLEAYQITQNPLYAETVHDLLTYVLRDMTSAEGAFWSAEDADSEGEEGRFYVWRASEWHKELGRDVAGLLEPIFNIQAQGNWSEEATGHPTGSNILHMTKSWKQWAEQLNTSQESLRREWHAARERLFEVRGRRVHPLKDDKILTDWNGLMIAALALAARVLNAPSYAAAACQAVQFILKRMVDAKGRLLHRYRDGQAAIKAHSEDYAYLILGLLELYQTTFETEWIEQAIALQERMERDFWDQKQGGFFLTAQDGEMLPVRPKQLYDGALPSDNSVAFHNLLRLSRLTGDTRWDEMARALMHAFAGTIAPRPAAFTYFLLGLDFALGQGQEIVLSYGLHEPNVQEILTSLGRNFNPHQVALLKTSQNAQRLEKVASYTASLAPQGGQPTAHICRGFACGKSTTDMTDLAAYILEKGTDQKNG